MTEALRFYHLLIWLHISLFSLLASVCFLLLKMRGLGASLTAQWLRICLLMQGTRVRALVSEDPTCRRAARPVSHNY